MDRTAALFSGIAALALVAGGLVAARAQVDGLALRGDVAPSDAQPGTQPATAPIKPALNPSVATAATPQPAEPAITGSVTPDENGILVAGDPFADPFADDPFAVSAPAASAAPLAPAPGSLPALPGAVPAVSSASTPARTTTPRRKKPSEEDPWQPTGVKVGSFILRPAVDVTGGWESNPAGVRGGSGSSYTTVQGALDVASDWAHDSFTASLRGGYTRYFDLPDLDVPTASGNADLKVDVGHDVTADLQLRGGITTQNSYSPNLPAGVVGRPEVYNVGTTIGATWKPNRLSLTAEGLVDRYLYQDIKLANGTTASAADQNETDYELRLRAGYDLTPDFTPFVQASVNRHQRDLTVDFAGDRESSSGVGAVVGARWGVPGLITAEGDVGYQVQRPDDRRLPDLSGPVFDASVVYNLSALTTITLKGSTGIGATVLPGSPGALDYSGRLQVDHALRRWLTVTAALGFEHIDYTGVALTQDLYTAELAVEWKLSRDVALRARLAHNRLASSVPGQSYSDEVAEVGVRLMR
jgi:hypothetical protein